jgi:hypothetical protein
MVPMPQTIVTVALCLLGGQSAQAAPLLNARNLAIDLGYGIYQGVHNFTTQLNVWKGYVNYPHILDKIAHMFTQDTD